MIKKAFEMTLKVRKEIYVFNLLSGRKMESISRL